MSTEDRYMKALWKQEREERWGLYRTFRQAFNDYQGRVGKTKDGYYHAIPDDTGLGSTVVIDHNNLGHDDYVYMSTFTGTELEPGILLRSMRSFAVGKTHYAIRWRFSNERIRNAGDPDNEFASRTIDEGPTSNFGRRLLFGGRRPSSQWDSRVYRYMSFYPETNWTPPAGEQIEVRNILQQAIGEIIMLGYENDIVPLSPDISMLHGIR
jgi:hypothetical protein